MSDYTDEVWLMSNRQPWVEALLQCLITCKTRSINVTLPPAGATVYLHASQAMWRGWRDLWWVKVYRLGVGSAFQRGGVVGVATVAEVGPTDLVMPFEDEYYFFVDALEVDTWCGGEQTILFTDVRRIPFIECRGAQVPTRKLPPAVRKWHEANLTG